MKRNFITQVGGWIANKKKRKKKKGPENFCLKNISRKTVIKMSQVIFFFLTALEVFSNEKRDSIF